MSLNQNNIAVFTEFLIKFSLVKHKKILPIVAYELTMNIFFYFIYRCEQKVN